jgi:hypothetical protein
LFFAFPPWLAQQENQLIILSGVVLLTRNGKSKMVEKKKKKKKPFSYLRKMWIFTFPHQLFCVEEKSCLSLFESSTRTNSDRSEAYKRRKK